MEVAVHRVVALEMAALAEPAEAPLALAVADMVADTVAEDMVASEVEDMAVSKAALVEDTVAALEAV
jgi:hypothetical protein